MPNWVFNTLENYDKEVYEKYKGEDTDIDFNKIIKEPEEITNTASSSYNSIAKNIYNYRELQRSGNLNYSNDPLVREISKLNSSLSSNIGIKCIQNPDKSLNELMNDESNKLLKSCYEEYIDIFGANQLYDCRSKGIDCIENYIASYNKLFVEAKKCYVTGDVYKNFKDIEEYGKRLVENENKYGFDNWYDWRCANWGTKWNACNSEYSQDAECLRFDTPWDLPEPILAKIAKDNPDKNIKGYSEEETGWFVNYNLSGGTMNVTSEGEINWDENTDETMISKEEKYDPPKTISFNKAKKDYCDEWKRFINVGNKLFNS